jgi:hypothetical protein
MQIAAKKLAQLGPLRRKLPTAGCQSERLSFIWPTNEKLQPALGTRWIDTTHHRVNIGSCRF